MFHVYIIYNDVYQKYYIGYTTDLEKRLLRHNKILPNKQSSFTSKNPGTWKLIYKESFDRINEAKTRERHFKSGMGREYIKTHILAQLADQPTADF